MMEKENNHYVQLKTITIMETITKLRGTIQGISYEGTSSVKIKFNCTERTTNRHNLSYGPPKE